MTKKSTNTGKELERYVADAYRKMGAKVEHDVDMAGNQIDVYVELEMADRSLHRIAIEAKDWTDTVGIAVINKFATIVNLLRNKGQIDRGIIVSASGFSKQARNAAKEYSIRLMEPADLDAMVSEAKSPEGIQITRDIRQLVTPTPEPEPVEPLLTELLPDVLEISEEMIDSAKLRQNIEAHFDKGDMEVLCHDVHLPYGNLSRPREDTTALQIVNYCKKHGRLLELLDYCQRKHSHVDWQSTVRKNSGK